MERLKSKTTLLVAFVLATVLAMTGVGYALANPNDGSDSDFDHHAAMHEKTTAEFLQWMKAHDNDAPCAICSGEYCNEINESRINEGTQKWYTVNHGSAGFPCEYLVYASFDDIVDDLPDNSAFIQWLMGKDDLSSDEPASTVALNFNFKATGIQATGFSDYHEAFTALNN